MSVRFYSVALMTVLIPTAGHAAPDVDQLLQAGDLAGGEKALADHLELTPADNQARFGLGIIQFLQGVEGLGQFLHEHGVSERISQIPFFRLPVPSNPSPEVTSYEDYRAMLERLLADLAEADATLSKIDGDVKLPLHFGRIRLDLDGDGTASEQEALWRIYAVMNQQVSRQSGFEEQATQFVIAFDTGDVYWLRGYCHLLSAMIEIQLAYDGQPWFDHCGHLLFAKTDSPYTFLPRNAQAGPRSFEPNTIADLITAIHLLNFELKEPRRMAAARDHLLAMTELSRQSWKAILAETDNEAEWLPNPSQQSVTGVAVTAEMIEGWQQVLAEFEAILNGQKLIPFWRDPSQGINLQRVFAEPKPFDLVLWVQGTAAVPYLEKGETTSPATWTGIARIFRGNFIGFALWFN